MYICMYVIYAYTRTYVLEIIFRSFIPQEQSTLGIVVVAFLSF